MTRPTFLRAILLVPLLVLSACTALSTPYIRPALPAGPAWSAVEKEAERIAPHRWWLAFADPRLVAVAAALPRSSGVMAAALRARRARLRAALAGNALFPKLSGALETSASQTFATSGQIAVSGLNAGRSGAQTLYASSGTFSISYDLDIWGRLGAQADAAALEAEASLGDLEAARLATIGTAIELYLRLAVANQAIERSGSSVAHAREVMRLVTAESRSGAATDLEIAEARQSLATQQATLVQQRQARAVLVNAMVVLLDGDAASLPEPKRPPAARLPALDPGLPSELLARRPDLMAAEAQLRATLRNVDATRASFYPPIVLTGALGTSSQQLLSFLANPLVSLGVGTTLTFLNRKDMNLAIGISRLQYEEAVTGFRAALLGGLAEIADRLNARSALAERDRFLRRSLAVAIDAERLTGIRYKAGEVGLRAWLDAQERRRLAEAERDANRLKQLLNQSALYRALDGGPRRQRQEPLQREKTWTMP